MDPSCGSGIFLIETYRKIIENNLSENKKISGEKLKNLLVNCVYGINIDCYKPNDYKNWHKAIAFMDLNEFMDAILKWHEEGA